MLLRQDMLLKYWLFHPRSGCALFPVLSRIITLAMSKMSAFNIQASRSHTNLPVG
jgi:hypothetical protein